jgi:hypothetical protein
MALDQPMNAPMMTQESFPYTPLEEAVALLHNRRAAFPLATGNMLERHFALRPYAVLFRHVATPNFELERFVALASSANLTPLILEFPQDKFVTCNPAKLALARMSFYAGLGRNGGPRNRVLTITDVDAADRRSLCQVTTNSGRELVPFHHTLLRSRPELRDLEIVDGSPFLLAHSGGAPHYYPEVFTLFVRHAILFESFLFTPSDQQFTTQIAIPAFNAVSKRHGCHPLICRLDPPETEGNSYWYHYPDELHECVVRQLLSNPTHKENDQ